MRSLFVAVFTAISVGASAAEVYPTKPVRMVVPFAPGGGLDITARLLGQKLGESLRQTVIIDNRTGAGGNIGAEIVAKAAPDGHTLLYTSASLAVNASLYPKLQYDARRDFAPVSLVASVPLVLIVPAASQTKTLKELIAAAKAKPGALTFASNGAGTTSHLSGELMGMLAGAKMTHVPYKGGGPATASVVAGETNMSFNTIPSALPQIKAGRLRAIAVSTAKPAPTLPGVPTVGSVLAGFDTDNWYGLLAPAKTPRAIVERLHHDVAEALKAPEVRNALVTDGAEPIGSTPVEFARSFAADIDKYAKVVKASGATAN